MVRVRHVLAGELRDGVRPAGLADRAGDRDARLRHAERLRAEDLARREVDDPLEGVLRRQPGLEGVERADHVHAHRPHRALADGVDASDGGAVGDVRGASCRGPKGVGVEDVALLEREVGVLRELGARQRVPVEVVVGDDLVVVDEPARDRGADEPGPAGDQDPLARQSHARKPSDVPSGAMRPVTLVVAGLAAMTLVRHGSGDAVVEVDAARRLQAFRAGDARRAQVGLHTAGWDGACSRPAPAPGWRRHGASVRARSEERRVHRDLRRPADGACHRVVPRPPHLGRLPPHERVRDRPLEPPRVPLPEETGSPRCP